MFFALIFTLKEKRQHKSEKEFENEEKRKSAVTFVTALFFLVAGSGISRRASQSEWTLGGLYYEKLDRFALFLFAFPFAFESSLSTLLEMQKASHQ
jgi:hypothetical protein